MKPIFVRFGCFGPYMEAQTVDFTLLEKSGLFLICGETGSGKTTILDAMCYALYGKSSGGLRGDLSVMRCKQAKETDETFVEFIFQSGANRYRFFRSLKPRKKRKATEDRKKVDYNATCECQIWQEDAFVPLPDAKDNETYLNKKAQEIIGLTYEQFKQVIILPQGQFEKLLVSDSKEKEQILVTLFHAQRWSILAESLYRQAKEESDRLEQERQRIAERLRAYSCTTHAELEDLLTQKAEALTALRQALEQSQTAFAACRKRYDDALPEEREFALLDSLKKELDTLLRQQEGYRLEELALEQADRAERITPQYREFSRAASDLEKGKKALEAAQENHRQAKQELEKAQSGQADHARGKDANEEKKGEILRLETAAEQYRTLSDKEKAVQKAQKDLLTAENQEKSKRKELEKAQKNWENAIENHRKATEERQRILDGYLKGIGSTLAQGLEEGSPCPVCGSPHHPNPAQPTHDHVTEAELEESTEKERKAAEAEAATLEGYMQAKNAHDEALRLLSVNRQAVAVAEEAHRIALAQRIPGIDTEQALNARLEQLRKDVSDYEANEKTLQEQVNEAVSEERAASKGVEKAQSERTEAEQAFARQKELWETACAEAGFDGELQYQAAYIAPEEKQERQKKLSEYQAKKKTTQEQYTRQAQALTGKVRPDIAAAKEALADSEKKRDGIQEEVTIATSKLESMEQEAKALTQRQSHYQTKRVAADESMAFAKRLRGDSGVSLQRYVLGVMLTSITVAANRLLRSVYAGRYQLHRTDEVSGSSHKRGLELEVYDANNNERRSVTTLSGGEKFLVSLSLAIGLSTVVQAQGKGVELGAMFIDEGFGSLDAESINDALEILQGIRKSSGLVGIISHVDRLAETIPAKIQITKTKTGSQCHVQV